MSQSENGSVDDDILAEEIESWEDFRYAKGRRCTSVQLYHIMSELNIIECVFLMKSLIIASHLGPTVKLIIASVLTLAAVVCDLKVELITGTNVRVYFYIA